MAYLSVSIIMMSALPAWGGTTTVQCIVVLLESGNPNSGSAEDLVQRLMMRKVLQNTRCLRLMPNIQKLYCSFARHIGGNATSEFRTVFLNTLCLFSRTTGIQASHDEQNDHRGRVVHNLEVLDSNLGQVTSLL